MLRSKSLYIFASVIVGALSQGYHTNLGTSGSFINFGGAVSHTAPVRNPPPPSPAYHTQGAYQQPAYSAPSHQPAYSAPSHQPAYSAPSPQPSYSAPSPQPAYSAPSHQPAYSAPSSHPTYSRPASYSPAVEPSVPSYSEKCSLDYVEEEAEICTPTIKTECEKEEVTNGVYIREEEECYKITRTVCTEDQEIEQTEVCAVAYRFQQVPAEAKLVEVNWSKECREEKFCAPSPVPAYGAPAPSYSQPEYCHQEHIKKTCYLSPVVVPVVKKVTLKLPQPVDTCITKDIVLPRIRCQQVTEQRCGLVPRAVPGEKLEIDKCTASLGEEQCSPTSLKLPRQACLETIKKVVTVYEEEAKPSYNAYY